MFLQIVISSKSKMTFKFCQKYQLSYGPVEDGKYFTTFWYFVNLLYITVKYQKQFGYLANIIAQANMQ